MPSPMIDPFNRLYYPFRFLTIFPTIDKPIFRIPAERGAGSPVYSKGINPLTEYTFCVLLAAYHAFASGDYFNLGYLI